jgi:nickel transport protein
MMKRNNLQLTICNLQFAILLLLLYSSSIYAHSIDVFAQVEPDAVKGTSIQGKAAFHDGTPVKNADVKAFDPSDKEIGRTKTDDQGKFTLKAEYRCDYRILVDAGDGHGGEYRISAGVFPAELPTRGSSDTTQAEIEASRQKFLLFEIHADVDALQEQLDQYEHRIRFRDILGGIGFIVGLAGAAYGYYYRGLLRNKTQSRE